MSKKVRSAIRQLDGIMKPLQDQVRLLTNKIIENHTKGELFIGELTTVIKHDNIFSNVFKISRILATN